MIDILAAKVYWLKYPPGTHLMVNQNVGPPGETNFVIFRRRREKSRAEAKKILRKVLEKSTKTSHNVFESNKLGY